MFYRSHNKATSLIPTQVFLPVLSLNVLSVPAWGSLQAFFHNPKTRESK